MATLADVFRVLNRLVEDGVIGDYAVAGGMAFLFYAEPARTYDLDVFVFLPPQEGSIVSMRPLYSALRARGYEFDAEHVMIHETPVQFIPAYNALAEEAVDKAKAHEYEAVPVRVIGPEHLIALAYQTGGSHRLERAVALLKQAGRVDQGKLRAILAAHQIAVPPEI